MTCPICTTSPVRTASPLCAQCRAELVRLSPSSQAQAESVLDALAGRGVCGGDEVEAVVASFALAAQEAA